MSTEAFDVSPALSSHNLEVAPAAHHPALLSGVNLQVFPGRLHGLAGPNGCGKTTLISTLAGFRKPRAGNVRLAHRDIRSVHPTDRARSIAVVLTERTDTAFLHVDELVALGRLPFNPGAKLRKIDQEICADAMARMGLEHLRRRRVATLSDGERQRALIARAIAQAPSVLLLDEPTAHLDVAGEVDIISHLLYIAREDSIAVLASSHKLQLMLSWCDSLSLIHPDGALVTGIPEELALAGEV
ncbi:MAG: ABC transporter ATP-binding protein, partial [Spirochaetia bacterium]